VKNTITKTTPNDHWQKAVRCPDCNMIVTNGDLLDYTKPCFNCGGIKRYWCAIKFVQVLRNNLKDRIAKWLGRNRPVLDQYYLLKGSYKKVRVIFHWDALILENEKFVTWEISE
jgi:hypothetical protein